MTASTPLGATLALVLATALAWPAAAADDAFDAALQHCENCQWPQAFDAFAALADAGDARAARIATQGVRYGRPLYGQTFVVATPRVEHWRAAASRTVALTR